MILAAVLFQIRFEFLLVRRLLADLTLHLEAVEDSTGHNNDVRNSFRRILGAVAWSPDHLLPC